MKSLRGTFNNVKRKKSTGSSGGSEKKWCHFDRMSFLDPTGYKTTDSQSNSPEDEDYITEDDMVIVQNQATTVPIGINNDQTCVGRPTSTARPALQQHVTTPACVTVTDAQSCITATAGRPATLAAPRALPERSNSRGNKSLSRPPTPSSAPDELTSAVLKMTGAIEDENMRRNEQGTSPNAVYVQYVAERLNRIKSARALLVLQNKIDNLIHEALINEIDDDM